MKAGRPVLSKAAFKARVRSICKSQKAQTVAKHCALSLKKVCQEVVAKNGALARS